MSRSRTLYRDRETFPRHPGKRGPKSLDGTESELQDAKRLARAGDAEALEAIREHNRDAQAIARIRSRVYGGEYVPLTIEGFDA